MLKKVVFYGFGLLIFLALSIYLSFSFFSQKDILFEKLNFNKNFVEIINEHPYLSINLRYFPHKKTINQKLSNFAPPLSKIKVVVTEIPQENKFLGYGEHNEMIAYGHSIKKIKPGIIDIFLYVNPDLINLLKEPQIMIETSLELELYKAIYTYENFELKKNDMIDHQLIFKKEQESLTDAAQRFNYEQDLEAQNLINNFYKAKNWLEESQAQQQNLFIINYE